MDIVLEVMICTWKGAGLGKVAQMNLPEVSGIRYLVACQNPGSKDDLSAQMALFSQRTDVVIKEFDNIGLGQNRQNALEMATAPLVLIADDDLTYSAPQLKSVIDTFENNPGIDYAAFRSIRPEHAVYPPHPHTLGEPYPGYWPTSFEIAFRRVPALDAGVRFSPLAGINAPYLGSGEEDFLMNRFYKSPLKGRFFPVDIVTHPGNTTCVRSAHEPSVLRARGAVLYKMYGPVEGPARSLVAAWRNGGNVPRSLWYMLQGIVYAIRHSREL